MNGILPIWKPVEITSYDVIRDFKRNVHPDFKIGHGGTLDPFAEGVLLLLLGRATKKMNELSALPKTYRATAILGGKSETLDRTGTIEQCHSLPAGKAGVTVSQIQIEEAAQKFVGEIEQEIPDYSATKVNGVPRYKLARAGKETGKKSKKVVIYELRIMKYEGCEVTFETTVSSGTYIRQLSYDLFKSLGIESYLDQLVRTQIGDFSKEKCCEISDLQSEGWRDKIISV